MGIQHDFDDLLRHVRSALPAGYAMCIELFSRDTGSTVILHKRATSKSDGYKRDFESSDGSPCAALQAALAHAVREAGK